jgi:hypothetical protein
MSSRLRSCSNTPKTGTVEMPVFDDPNRSDSNANAQRERLKLRR